jgi:hypothetical protein
MNQNTDGPYTIHGMAWIDWNRDGDFEDVGEEFDMGTAYNVVDGPTTLSPKSITIPADAHLGKTTMRVAAKYGSDPDPCEEGYDGEVEDYTIFIKPVIALDYNIEEMDVCEGEKIHFAYTGTPLDEIQWSFTDGFDTYTSEEFEDSLLLLMPGTYDLTLQGWEGELTVTETFPNAVDVWPVYDEFIEMSICQGETYVLGTQTLTETGEYTEPFVTVHGCDSIVTLTLSVLSLDNSVLAGTYELTANLSGATYQWLDCNADWAEIDGATEQTFEPLENGSYAVIVNDGACADTSDCFDIVALSTGENALAKVNIYPNPSSGEFTVQLDRIVDVMRVEIYDAAGRTVYVNSGKNTQTIQVDTDFATGTYFVAVFGVQNEKIILQIIIE